MWKFLFTEFDWTEFVTNTLALMFGTMTVVVIIYAAVFSEDKEMMAAAGSVTSGITGVIFGYYFNRSRLHQAQNQADDALERLRNQADEVDGGRDTRRRLEVLTAEYDSPNRTFEDFVATMQILDIEEEDDGSE